MKKKHTRREDIFKSLFFVYFSINLFEKKITIDFLLSILVYRYYLRVITATERLILDKSMQEIVFS